ncbi:MAG: T9SS type A sorting domain-containing protein [Bacteroidetes bacterium]|nr:T9SS type A sorting domain-containing protein [Bacteroidota bacterium]
MKKIFTILSLVSILNGFSQISITSADMPTKGDTIRYSVSPTGTLDFRTNGANYNWDYSLLGLSSQDVYKYLALASTPYSSLVLSGMPFGAFGYKIADSIGGGGTSFKDIYNFYEKTSVAWNAVGTAFTIPLGGTPIKTGGVYSDKDEIFKFPLNYNDYDSTTFKVVTPLGISFFNVGSFTQKGYRLTKVEGWGKITTPYATDISCLKVKSKVVEIDSLKLAIPGQQPITVGFPVTRVEYKWLSKSEKIPVLEVIGTELGNTFTPTSIRYRDNYRKVAASPFSPKIKFTVNKNMGKTQVDTFKFNNTTTPTFGTTYQWSFTPSTGVRYVKNTTASSANPSVVFDNTGVYSVKLIATNFSGPRDSTAVNMITISNTNNISKLNLEQTIFYPNPVRSIIQLVDKNLVGKTMRVFDIHGKLVLEENINDQLNVNCDDLANGNYTFVIVDSETLIVKQFIKQ